MWWHAAYIGSQASAQHNVQVQHVPCTSDTITRLYYELLPYTYDLSSASAALIKGVDTTFSISPIDNDGDSVTCRKALSSLCTITMVNRVPS